MRAAQMVAGVSVVFALASCTHVKVQPVSSSTEGTALWAVVTGTDGTDHVLFCTARGIAEGSAQPSACYDMTPWEGKQVGTIGVPFVPLVSPAPAPR